MTEPQVSQAASIWNPVDAFGLAMPYVGEEAGRWRCYFAIRGRCGVRREWVGPSFVLTRTGSRQALRLCGCLETRRLTLLSQGTLRGCTTTPCVQGLSGRPEGHDTASGRSWLAAARRGPSESPCVSRRVPPRAEWHGAPRSDDDLWPRESGPVFGSQPPCEASEVAPHGRR
jgi:hypothetical protein